MHRLLRSVLIVTIAIASLSFVICIAPAAHAEPGTPATQGYTTEIQPGQIGITQIDQKTKLPKTVVIDNSNGTCTEEKRKKGECWCPVSDMSGVPLCYSSKTNCLSIPNKNLPDGKPLSLCDKDTMYKNGVTTSGLYADTQYGMNVSDQKKSSQPPTQSPITMPGWGANLPIDAQNAPSNDTANTVNTLKSSAGNTDGGAVKETIAPPTPSEDAATRLKGTLPGITVGLQDAEPLPGVNSLTDENGTFSHEESHAESSIDNQQSGQQSCNWWCRMWGGETQPPTQSEPFEDKSGFHVANNPELGGSAERQAALTEISPPAYDSAGKQYATERAASEADRALDKSLYMGRLLEEAELKEKAKTVPESIKLENGKEISWNEYKSGLIATKAANDAIYDYLSKGKAHSDDVAKTLQDIRDNPTPENIAKYTVLTTGLQSAADADASLFKKEYEWQTYKEGIWGGYIRPALSFGTGAQDLLHKSEMRELPNTINKQNVTISEKIFGVLTGSEEAQKTIAEVQQAQAGKLTLADEHYQTLLKYSDPSQYFFVRVPAQIAASAFKSYIDGMEFVWNSTGLVGEVQGLTTTQVENLFRSDMERIDAGVTAIAETGMNAWLVTSLPQLGKLGYSAFDTTIAGFRSSESIVGSFWSRSAAVETRLGLGYGDRAWGVVDRGAVGGISETVAPVSKYEKYGIIADAEWADIPSGMGAGVRASESTALARSEGVAADIESTLGHPVSAPVGAAEDFAAVTPRLAGPTEGYFTKAGGWVDPTVQDALMISGSKYSPIEARVAEAMKNGLSNPGTHTIIDATRLGTAYVETATLFSTETTGSAAFRSLDAADDVASLSGNGSTVGNTASFNPSSSLGGTSPQAGFVSSSRQTASAAGDTGPSLAVAEKLKLPELEIPQLAPEANLPAVRAGAPEVAPQAAVQTGSLPVVTSARPPVQAVESGTSAIAPKNVVIEAVPRAASISEAAPATAAQTAPSSVAGEAAAGEVIPAKTASVPNLSAIVSPLTNSAINQNPDMQHSTVLNSSPVLSSIEPPPQRESAFSRFSGSFPSLELPSLTSLFPSGFLSNQIVAPRITAPSPSPSVSMPYTVPVTASQGVQDASTWPTPRIQRIAQQFQPVQMPPPQGSAYTLPTLPTPPSAPVTVPVQAPLEAGMPEKMAALKEAITNPEVRTGSTGAPDANAVRTTPIASQEVTSIAKQPIVEPPTEIAAKMALNEVARDSKGGGFFSNVSSQAARFVRTIALSTVLFTAPTESLPKFFQPLTNFIGVTDAFARDGEFADVRAGKMALEHLMSRYSLADLALIRNDPEKMVEVMNVTYEALRQTGRLAPIFQDKAKFFAAVDAIITREVGVPSNATCGYNGCGIMQMTKTAVIGIWGEQPPYPITQIKTHDGLNIVSGVLELNKDALKTGNLRSAALKYNAGPFRVSYANSVVQYAPMYENALRTLTADTNAGVASGLSARGRFTSGDARAFEWESHLRVQAELLNAKPRIAFADQSGVLTAEVPPKALPASSLTSPPQTPQVMSPTLPEANPLRVAAATEKPTPVMSEGKTASPSPTKVELQKSVDAAQSAVQKAQQKVVTLEAQAPTVAVTVSPAVKSSLSNLASTEATLVKAMTQYDKGEVSAFSLMSPFKSYQIALDKAITAVGSPSAISSESSDVIKRLETIRQSLIAGRNLMNAARSSLDMNAAQSAKDALVRARQSAQKFVSDPSGVAKARLADVASAKKKLAIAETKLAEAQKALDASGPTVAQTVPVQTGTKVANTPITNVHFPEPSVTPIAPVETVAPVVADTAAVQAVPSTNAVIPEVVAKGVAPVAPETVAVRTIIEEPVVADATSEASETGVVAAVTNLASNTLEGVQGFFRTLFDNPLLPKPSGSTVAIRPQDPRVSRGGPVGNESVLSPGEIPTPNLPLGKPAPTPDPTIASTEGSMAVQNSPVVEPASETISAQTSKLAATSWRDILENSYPQALANLEQSAGRALSFVRGSRDASSLETRAVAPSSVGEATPSVTERVPVQQSERWTAAENKLADSQKGTSGEGVIALSDRSLPVVVPPQTSVPQVAYTPPKQSVLGRIKSMFGLEPKNTLGKDGPWGSPARGPLPSDPVAAGMTRWARENGATGASGSGGAAVPPGGSGGGAGGTSGGGAAGGSGDSAAKGGLWSLIKSHPKTTILGGIAAWWYGTSGDSDVPQRSPGMAQNTPPLPPSSPLPVPPPGGPAGDDQRDPGAPSPGPAGDGGSGRGGAAGAGGKGTDGVGTRSAGENQNQANQSNSDTTAALCAQYGGTMVNGQCMPRSATPSTSGSAQPQAQTTPLMPVRPTLTCSPSTFRRGSTKPVTIEWSCSSGTNVSTIGFSAHTTALTGSTSVTPAVASRDTKTLEYAVACMNGTTEVGRNSCTVTVRPPLAAALLANPSTVESGAETKIVWGLTETVPCALYGPSGVVGVSSTQAGMTRIELTRSSEFVLMCDDLGTRTRLGRVVVKVAGDAETPLPAKIVQPSPASSAAKSAPSVSPPTMTENEIPESEYEYEDTSSGTGSTNTGSGSSSGSSGSETLECSPEMGTSAYIRCLSKGAW